MGLIKLNILVITQYFWPENFRINDLVFDLQSRGHKVTIYTGLPNYPEGKIFSGYGLLGKYTEEINGVKVIRVPLISRGKGSNIRLVLNYFSFVLFSCLLVPFRLRNIFDVIFVFEPSPVTVCIPAILVKKIKKTPIIFWVQDLWPESLSATGVVKSNYLLKPVNKLVKYIYNSCNLILVQSKAFIPSIEKYNIQKEKILYFPNSAEKIYKPIESSLKSKILIELPAGFKIIFAGNIGSSQSMETVVKAATLLKHYTNICWIIIGDGRKKNWLECEIKRKKISSNVFLLGEKPLEHMPYYFSEGDILLATLKRDPIFSLTIPSKIQSYLACGKPIIASIDGEAANVIKESGAGIAVEAENAQKLADAVLDLYNMPEEDRKKMGRLGRKYFEEHFESKKLVAKLENWMMKI